MRLIAMVLAAAFLLSGCASTTTYVEDDMSVRVTGSPIDENGRATFDVTLTLEEPLTYTHPGCGPDLFSARVQHGEGIPLGEYGREPMFGPCVIREMTLPAGTHTATFHWNGNDGLMDGANPHGGKRVPAGSYDVRVELRGDSGKFIGAKVTVS